MLTDGTIRGEREVLLGNDRVTINGRPLDPARSLALRQHSPTGFSWGYLGSGPGQLALAILLEVTDQPTALRMYQDFKVAWIAPLQGDTWELQIADIVAWIGLVDRGA